jgi:hypothetical protein
MLATEVRLGPSIQNYNAIFIRLYTMHYIHSLLSSALRSSHLSFRLTILIFGLPMLVLTS